MSRVAGHTLTHTHHDTSFYIAQSTSNKKNVAVARLHAMFVQSEKYIRRFSWKTKKR